jgi:hypothetical protein
VAAHEYPQQPKVANRPVAYKKKMLIYDEQSGYVYENKQKDDKMPGKKSDIYG